MGRNGARFRHIRVVEKLHHLTAKARTSRGFSLVEALAAVAVLGVAATGITAVGVAARRLAEGASVRAAQGLATHVVIAALDGTRAWPGGNEVQVGRRRLAFAIDTTRLAPTLLEVRIVVSGHGPVGPRETVTRRAALPP